jgi:hypothetical protein
VAPSSSRDSRSFRGASQFGWRCKWRVVTAARREGYSRTAIDRLIGRGDIHVAAVQVAGIGESMSDDKGRRGAVVPVSRLNQAPCTCHKTTSLRLPHAGMAARIPCR